MGKKDKFQQMQQGGGALGSSFQDIANTVAAIEKQAEQPVQSVKESSQPAAAKPQAPSDATRFMRLPNPQIPIAEYNLVSRYCEQFANMTRQDFVELAIIEKLHNDAGLPQEDFNRRYDEIRNRPPRGHRKNTKNQTSK